MQWFCTHGYNAPQDWSGSEIEISYCDGPNKASSRSVSQTNTLQGSSVCLVRSGIYNSGIKLFSDALLGIDPLLSLPSDQIP